MAYTPLASKAAACAGLRMVVPAMGDSKLMLAALLNGNDKKTGSGARVSRRGPQVSDSDGEVQLAGAWSMVPANELVAAVVTAS